MRRIRFISFGLGAGLVGAADTLLLPIYYLFPDIGGRFTTKAFIITILGGMGSIPGAILGATVVTVLNLQVLKGLSLWLNELRSAGVTILGYNLANLPTQLEPAKYERMIFGIILVLMMIYRPQGILPARRRSRELGGSK